MSLCRRRWRSQAFGPSGAEYTWKYLAWSTWWRPADTERHCEWNHSSNVTDFFCLFIFSDYTYKICHLPQHLYFSYLYYHCPYYYHFLSIVWVLVVLLDKSNMNRTSPTVPTVSGGMQWVFPSICLYDDVSYFSVLNYYYKICKV